MQNIRIITDSASDISFSAPQLTVLPMAVRFGDEVYLDGVDLTHHEFYEKLVESDVLPTTSLISPADFEAAFAKAVDADENVLCITISSDLSGTFQSAQLAAENFANRVYIVDSRNAATGEQILVLRAMELVQRGLDIQEIASILEREREEIHTIALLDTLEYLKKGGRIPKAAALVGGVLALKPVLGVQNGAITMLGTARGSRNGNNLLVKEIEKTNGVDFSRPIRLGYSGLNDALLQKYLRDSANLWQGHVSQLEICTLGATIGTHAGPNAIAVSFFSK